jgi:hypothetical protein
LPKSQEKTHQHVPRGAHRSDSAPAFKGGLHPIAQLQRTLGNRRVVQLIQAKQLTPAGKIPRKLTVGPADDQYEQEADRVARQVVSMPNAEASNSQERRATSLADSLPGTTNGPLSQRPATEKQKAEPIRTKAAGSSAGGFDAGADVETQVRLSKGRGGSLPEPVRDYMEPRFGMDFSHVRVHTGSDALQMNQAVGARAFTHGSDIYFGAGHDPGNLELTAHELTHVAQQTGGVPASDGRATVGSAPIALQRDPKKDVDPVPLDVAVIFDPRKDFVTLASAIAPGAKVLTVTSRDDLAKQLKAIKGPIRTVYFVSHMNEDGDLVFTSPAKGASPAIENFVQAETVALKVKDSAQVENIDFRGCNSAQAPTEMDKIRVALKATKATGSTCSLVYQIAEPMKLDGKEITRRKDVTDWKAFNRGFDMLHKEFKDGRKKCILNDSVDGYFEKGGKLMAYWANPGSMADQDAWDDMKSICYKNLRVETVDPKKPPVIGEDDCKRVEVGKKK